ILITATNNSQLNLTSVGGSFNDAGQNAAATNRNGLHLDFDNSDAQLDMNGTDFENAPQNGALLLFDNGSMLGTALTAASIANASFNGAGDDAIHLELDNVSSGFLNLTSVTGDNAGDDGFDFDVNNTSTLETVITTSSFDDAGSDGIIGNIDV